MKTCSKCGLEKPLSDFRKDPRYKDGLACWCRQCNSDYHRERYRNKPEARVHAAAYRAANREALKEKNARYYQLTKERTAKRVRAKKYGISVEQIDAMLQEQRGCCKICPMVLGKDFHVDHDHETGSVRGILCRGCNHGIGNFRDDVELLRNAIAYIEASRRERPNLLGK